MIEAWSRLPVTFKIAHLPLGEPPNSWQGIVAMPARAQIQGPEFAGATREWH
jgi:hypothetical protein